MIMITLILPTYQLACLGKLCRNISYTYSYTILFGLCTILQRASWTIIVNGIVNKPLPGSGHSNFEAKFSFSLFVFKDRSYILGLHGVGLKWFLLLRSKAFVASLLSVDVWPTL